MMFDRVKELSEQRGENLKIVAQKLGFSENAFYKWKTQSPKSETLEKVADYFDVSIDYLLGRTDKKRYYDLTEKDERDVERDLERILNSAESDLGLASFDGRVLDEMDEEDRELYITSLKNALRLHKRLAKKKFTPKKYR
ncbi:helix-turn-helix domain-containing protein [Lysinibacillus sp. NPDC096418]|uniref:helix-turn-helix domain-containing protein n=1 Tax=Lysinibacillus sp. NPDC096418 TaxID=3364138 RepID=UPI003807249C